MDFQTIVTCYPVLAPVLAAVIGGLTVEYVRTYPTLDKFQSQHYRGSALIAILLAILTMWGIHSLRLDKAKSGLSYSGTQILAGELDEYNGLRCASLINKSWDMYLEGNPLNSTMPGFYANLDKRWPEFIDGGGSNVSRDQLLHDFVEPTVGELLKVAQETKHLAYFLSDLHFDHAEDNRERIEAFEIIIATFQNIENFASDNLSKAGKDVHVDELRSKLVQLLRESQNQLDSSEDRLKTLLP